jgi:acyl-CoA reductase-like NAD-dependent aldehyde dehydrogenase
MHSANYFCFFFNQAFKTSWGLKAPGAFRGKLMNKLADLIERNIDEFAALEALDVGKFEALDGMMLFANHVFRRKTISNSESN